MLAWLLLCVLSYASAQSPSGPAIDGTVDDDEWAGARIERLEGGGQVRLLERGGFLYVAVEGRGQGLASLCAAEGGTVRILHASAALGEARYEARGGAWTRTAGFTWRVRDSRETGPPATQAERAAFLDEMGWLANASAAGSPVREFQIRAAGVEALGVTFLSFGDPMTLARWPSAMADDCASVRMAQGDPREAARFEPGAWWRVGGEQDAEKPRRGHEVSARKARDGAPSGSAHPLPSPGVAPRTVSPRESAATAWRSSCVQNSTGSPAASAASTSAVAT